MRLETEFGSLLRATNVVVRGFTFTANVTVETLWKVLIFLGAVAMALGILNFFRKASNDALRREQIYDKKNRDRNKKKR